VSWAIGEADVVFIAVGTPPDEDGSADLRHVLTSRSPSVCPCAGSSWSLPSPPFPSALQRR
jgi:hypothetical protein